MIEGVDWMSLNKDQKKDYGEMIGYYWEKEIESRLKRLANIKKNK